MAEATARQAPQWAIPAALATAAVVLLHHPLSYNLARVPMVGTDNEGLGLAAFALAAGVAWHRRDALRELAVAPDRRGWFLVVLGGLLALVGHQQEMRLPLAVSLPLILGGALWVAYGRQWAAALWFPLVLLVAVVPLPAEINKAISFPMQAIAARFAAIVVDLLGTPVRREGVTLWVEGRSILVSEGCSGWRTFTGAFWLFLVFTYWQQPPRWWQWVGYLLLLLPIAIAANTLRVITVVAGAVRGLDWLLDSPWHELVGFAYFIPLVWMLMSLTNQAPDTRANEPETEAEADPPADPSADGVPAA
ncbi:MAG: exosortase/archaeosortase family protein, partial [Armatimonadota bacterium]|nr:exosortase/archaeosortase family protein [Armatimonadota bacterium]